MYDALPKKEKSFTIDEVGETTGHKYQGTFEVLCVLNMGQRHAEATEKTRLMGDYANPDNDLYSLAETLSKLRIRIQEAPEWWKQSNGGTDIMDEEIVLLLWEKTLECERQWKKELKEKAETAQGNAPTEKSV
jgi:hypothetical protein